MIRVVRQNGKEMYLEIEIGLQPNETQFSYSEFSEIPILQELLKIGSNKIYTPGHEENAVREKAETYILGLYYYISMLRGIDDIDEEKIYLASVLAAALKSTYPLQRQLEYLGDRAHGDEFFWLQLSVEPKLFYSSLNTEMVRRRTISPESLKIYKIDREIDYKDIDHPENLIQGEEMKPIFEIARVFESHNLYPGGRGLSRLINLNKYTSNRFKRLNLGIEVEGTFAVNETFDSPLVAMKKIYTPDVIELVENILNGDDVVIAGGFVASIVNPVCFYVPVYKDGVILAPDELIRGLFTKGVEKRMYIDGKTTKEIREILRDFLKNLHLHLDDEDYDTPFNFRGAIDYFLNGESFLFNDYFFPLLVSLSGDYLVLIDGIYYYRYYQTSRDIDVFFTGDDHEEKANEMFDRLMYNHSIKKIYFSEFAVSMKLSNVENIHDDKTLPTVQIIKRKYDSLNEILAGFDIDPSSVAMIQGFEIYGTEAFIDSVRYGVNVVTPSRQSETFNQRILKYSERGYQPYVAGLSEIPLEGLPSPDDDHTLRQLRFLAKGINTDESGLEVWKRYKDVSDYSDTVLSGIRKSLSIHTLDQEGKTSITLEDGIENYGGSRWIEYFNDKVEEGGDEDNSYPSSHDISIIRRLKEKGSLLSTNDRRRAIKLGLIIPEMKDLLSLVNEVVSIIKDRGKYEVNQPCFRLANSIYKSIIELSWKKIHPGTQITGSFNPTHVDYLDSLQSEQKQDPYTEELTTLLSEFTIPVLSEVILSYKGPDVEDIYQHTLQKLYEAYNCFEESRYEEKFDFSPII